MKTYIEYKDKLVNLARRNSIFLNLDEPKTIQDKINWLKIYDSTPLKTRCADKIEIHKYCKEKIGEDLCVPIIQVYETVEDVKWDNLPNSFVIKCNHGSGMNIIVKDKKQLNIPDTIKKLNKFMKDDFAFHVGYEMHYHDIPHKIFVEEYLNDTEQVNSLFDYKFWCFNGEPKFYTINDGYGHGDIVYYDMDGKVLDPYNLYKPGIKYKKPKNFDSMIEYSKKLSEDFKFVRVDFYEVSGKLYLGELTFTPGAGFFKYKKKEYDIIFGDMLDLNKNNTKNVVIVNFNTQKLTECCIMSINKYTPGCNIYVFDNSNKTPFVNMFENVTVFDNTMGQIIDFDSILDRHKNSANSTGQVNNFGSMKHCASVEKCMELINNGFVLLDSDTLIKKDISDLFDEKYIFCSAIETMKPFKIRTAPYVLYINTKMCKDKEIHFFDEQHMFGFKDNNDSELYDTGSWFYEACKNLPQRKINQNNYIVHFRAGSWLEDARTKHNYKSISPDSWLKKHENLWETKEDGFEKITPSPSEKKSPSPRKLPPPPRKNNYMKRFIK